MASIEIPESGYSAIHQIATFTEEDFDLFLNALSDAEPALNRNKFWLHVAPRIKHIDSSLIKSLMNEIFQMYSAMEAMGLEINEFTETITEAMTPEKLAQFSLNQNDVKRIHDRLTRIFGGGKGFNITMKALDVLTDQDRTFYHAKILTDIRPVFNPSGDAVDASIIVHNLRIHFGENSEHKDFYVALDTSDIQSLREVLDRADAKAKCLQGLLKTSGIAYLDAEE
jgi:hypothetical protein